MSEPDTNSEDSQNLPSQSQVDVVPGQSEIVGVGVVDSWEGPLPSPTAFQRYEDTLPGAASRILKMAEIEQSNQHELQIAQHEYEMAALEVVRTNVVRGSWRSYLGMALGFVLAMTGIICGTYLAANGHSASGMALFVASLASLVGVSVYGLRAQSASRQRDAEDDEEE